MERVIKLIIVGLVLCFTAPAMAGQMTPRDDLFFKMGMAQAKINDLKKEIRDLQKELEMVEYAKVKLNAEIHKLSKSEKPDEKTDSKPAASPAGGR